MLLGAIVVLVKLVRARRLLKDAGLPRSGKVTFWAAVAYLVCPVDLLPDPIYLDDIGVLMLALRSLHKAAAAAAERRESDLYRPPGRQRW
nr:YkvA family protein [Actinacidiphila rubida]